MTVQQSVRFSEVDEESVNVLLQDFLYSALDEEGNDQPFVAKDTEKERDRIWAVWMQYVFSSLPRLPRHYAWDNVLVRC